MRRTRPRRASPTAPTQTAPAVHARRAPRPVACAILTVSDTRRGAEDVSGATAQTLIERAGHRVVTRAWAPDDVQDIRSAMRTVLERPDVDAVIVTGGTGLAPRDCTPEALAPMIQRSLPGFGELLRARSVDQVGMAAWLSRLGAGVAQGRLVVWLPGSRGAVTLALEQVLLPELVHAVRLLGRFGEE